jgi:hypothetical protein
VPVAASSRRAGCSTTGRDYDDGPRPDQPGLPAARRHRHRHAGGGLQEMGLGGRTTSRPTAPSRRRPAGRRGARRDQVGQPTNAVSSRQLDGAQPRRASPASRTRPRSSRSSARPTAKTAEEHGLRVDVMAPEASSDALVDALWRTTGAAWRSRPGGGGSRSAGPAPEATARAAEPAGATEAARAGRLPVIRAPAAAAERRRAGGWSPRPRLHPPSSCCRVFVKRGRDRAATRSPHAGGRPAHPGLAVATAAGGVDGRGRRVHAVRRADDQGRGGSGGDDPDGILNVAVARGPRGRRRRPRSSWPTSASTSSPTTATAGCSTTAARVDNDATLERYASMALAQARPAPTWSGRAG